MHRLILVAVIGLTLSVVARGKPELGPGPPGAPKMRARRQLRKGFIADGLSRIQTLHPWGFHRCGFLCRLQNDREAPEGCKAQEHPEIRGPPNRISIHDKDKSSRQPSSRPVGWHSASARITECSQDGCIFQQARRIRASPSGASCWRKEVAAFP